ncbi:hypothetical protein EPN95_03990 [Patescibacteria group bacterium]|nr:MAG: hypothetical protein EPN95_03990 [Patescibacteria group bacterium]
MELTITLSPTIIAALCLLGIAIVLRLVSDAKDIKSTARLNQHLRELGKKKTKKMIGVVIELRKKADTIVPLLDEIYVQGYSQQEVLILVHHTAGKNAASVLRQYKTSHKIKNFHVVTMRAKMTVVDLIKKYSRATLVTILTPEQHISKQFFDTIALDYSPEMPDRIILGRRIILNKTIRSAFEAQIMMWRQMILKRKKPTVSQALSSGIVYKRSSLLSTRSSGAIIYSSGVSIAEAPSIKKIFRRQAVSYASLFRRSVGLTLTVLIFAGLGYVFVAAAPQEILVLAASIIVAYLLIYIGMLSKQADYSFVDRLNLTLLAPIFLIVYTLLYLAGVLLALFTLPHLAVRRIRK